MEFTSCDKERIRHQFDAFCKKVLRCEARTIYRQMARLADHEISLTEFPEDGANLFAFKDEYSFDNQQFNVLGFDIAIKNDLLAEALRLLPEQRRDIILLYYFLGMNDREIAELLNVLHRTISYKRTNSLKNREKSWRDLSMKNTRNNLLPFDVIQAAAKGNSEALYKVLRHYGGYIARLSIRQMHDENGNLRWSVDEAIRRQLENKLVDAIVRRFKVA